MDENIERAVLAGDALCKELAVNLVTILPGDFSVFLKTQVDNDSNMGQIEDAMKIEYLELYQFIRFMVRSHDLYSTAQFIWEMCRALRK